MTKFKDFGSPSDSSAEPIEFQLYGERFSCRPTVPGKLMLEFASRTSDDSNSAENATVLLDFFAAVLYPESHERFDSIISDPDKAVSLESLMDIVSWLMETYGSRPTERSEPSSTGE